MADFYKTFKQSANTLTTFSLVNIYLKNKKHYTIIIQYTIEKIPMKAFTINHKTSLMTSDMIFFLIDRYLFQEKFMKKIKGLYEVSNNNLPC